MSRTLATPESREAPTTVTVPTTVVSHKQWTVEEAERLEGVFRFEIIEGVLYMTAMPAWPHAILAANVQRVLDRWVAARKLGYVVAAQTGIYITEKRYLDPDLLYLRRDQIPRKGGRLSAAALAVEVLSPSNLRAPREERERLFAQASVEELWYVDYEQQRLEIRRLAGEEYRTTATFTGEATVTSELFPGLEFPLSAAWEGAEE